MCSLSAFIRSKLKSSLLHFFMHIGCIEYVSLSLKGLRLLDESPKNPSISSTSNAEDKKDAKVIKKHFLKYYFY